MSEEQKVEEGQISDLSERVELSVELLHQFTDEKLTDYYNRTQEVFSKRKTVILFLAPVVMAIGAVGAFTSGDNGWAMFFAASGVLQALMVKVHLDDMANNKEIAQEIQADIAAMLPVLKP